MVCSGVRLGRLFQVSVTYAPDSSRSRAEPGTLMQSEHAHSTFIIRTQLAHISTCASHGSCVLMSGVGSLHCKCYHAVHGEFMPLSCLA